MNGFDVKWIVLAGLGHRPLGAASDTDGITRHVWTGVSGGNLADLRMLPSFPAALNLTSTLTNFSAPTNWADHYGTRVFGWVHAPVTGSYRHSIHIPAANQDLWDREQGPYRPFLRCG